MRRLMLYDRLGTPLGELAEADVFEAILREEINGEHSLEITTTRVLDKGIRMLYQDGRSKWREFVVAGVDAEHASGNRAIGTYYCVWSVQQDLQGVTVSVMPGVQSPVSAGTALDALLSTTSRWTRGTVTQMTTGSASMYDRSAWEALSVLVDVWGGEIDATITIGTQSGVVGRAVDLYAAQGEQTAMRRFDFGADLMSVKRTLADDPLFCRISPRGKGEQTDAGGYGRKITIESVNDGKDWLEYAPMVDAAKLPDGNGGYEYPTLIVENSDCETPADLKAWGESVLAQYCTPKVTYEIDVLQAGAEGVDVTGVSLGDAVQVVDRKFGGDGIRVQGRVRSITTDLLNERDITIVIGDGEQSVSSRFASVDKSLATVSNDLTVMSTADYIDNLLDRINTEINATGGYTYIVPGNGILTFDVAVADPLNPVEASQVVEIKGGSIRIANSRTAQGAWEWKTVFTSGHIAADLITAAQITTGYIGSADSGNYWDLDGGYLTIGARTRRSDALNPGYYRFKTQAGSVATLDDVIMSKLTGRVTGSVTNYILGLMIKALSDNQSTEYSHILIAPSATSNTSYHSAIACTGPLEIHGNYLSTGDYGYLNVSSSASITSENGTSHSYNAYFSAKSSGEAEAYGYTRVKLRGTSVEMWPGNTTVPRCACSISTLTVGYNSNVKTNLYVYGNSTVTGTKSRLVETDHYSDRLLYAYETPEPYFGDIGSGTIGDDGLCYVEIDDIFSETARADMAYQVFLQACGEGSLYVESKSSTHFVVRGTPGLSFDWELKAKQTGFEHLRLEDNHLSETTDNEREYGIDTDEVYSDELNYIDAIERVIYEAA